MDISTHDLRIDHEHGGTAADGPDRSSERCSGNGRPEGTDSEQGADGSSNDVYETEASEHGLTQQMTGECQQDTETARRQALVWRVAESSGLIL